MRIRIMRRMRCPYCSEDKDKVIDSRSTDGGRVIRRRRHCLNCDKRFTTYEHVETIIKMTVIKRDGLRVPYNREKMLSGIEKACYKRPVPAEKLIEICEETEEELFRKFGKEIPSIEIGNALSEKLKNVDHVAYVRFASIYKQFRDLDDFLDEVRDVLDSQPNLVPGQGKLFKAPDGKAQ